MITINYDFISGEEVSYAEGLEMLGNGQSFQTNCLNFFSFGHNQDVKVLKQDGSYILKSELLSVNNYTARQITKNHNIYKMLVAGALKFLEQDKE